MIFAFSVATRAIYSSKVSGFLCAPDARELGIVSGIVSRELPGKEGRKIHSQEADFVVSDVRSVVQVRAVSLLESRYIVKFIYNINGSTLMKVLPILCFSIVFYLSFVYTFNQFNYPKFTIYSY